ncbi:hypothetical protein AAG906_011246 [Vitis piasezkii]
MVQEKRNQANLHLEAVYDEIRPTIKKDKMKNQYNVPTNLVEKWIEANCSKMKADFNFHSSIIRNVLFPPQQASNEAKHLEQGENQSETK